MYIRHSATNVYMNNTDDYSAAKSHNLRDNMVFLSPPSVYSCIRICQFLPHLCRLQNSLTAVADKIFIKFRQIALICFYSNFRC